MAIENLHLTYAPIMRFSRGERFFPMSVQDFMSYSALYVKGQSTPLAPHGQVTLDDITARFNAQDVFLRSVPTGPIYGADVVKDWGIHALRLIYEWGRHPLVTWTEEMARSAYDWFSDKTRAATQRFWWNSLLLPQALADKLGGRRRELPRFKLPPTVREAAIQNYETSQGPNRNYTYYYRMAQLGEYLSLQYWLFYAYNDWAGGYGGFNDHEGDWEGLHIFFKLAANKQPIEPPAYVCYLGHESRMTKPWDHPEVEKIGTHPVVYVAAGSHASYPQSRQYPLMALYNLIDYATGDSFTLDHHDWRSRIQIDDAPWLAYRGSWGTRYWLSLEWVHKTLGAVAPIAAQEVDIPGVSAPRGPKYSAAGVERETWSNPLTFAGIK